MKVDIVTLENKNVGDIELHSDIFCLSLRKDLLARVLRWQLARCRAGISKVKGRSEVHYTTRKMFRQKGTGNARHGNASAPQFRHGGRAFGPHLRDYSFSLPKKVRSLGLKIALSMKLARGDLIVIDTFDSFTSGKTKDLAHIVKMFTVRSSLWIDGESVSEPFFKASKNIPLMDVLPVQGLNVYDILRREKLILSKKAIDKLENRFL